MRAADAARRTGGPDLARELDQARQAWAHDKSEWRRMHYGYLLLLSAHRQQDLLRAITVLEPLLRDGRGQGAESARLMAGLLSGLAAEMQRLGEQADSAQQKARDEQRRADHAEERALQLQLKLDRLTSLERSLYRRERKHP